MVGFDLKMYMKEYPQMGLFGKWHAFLGIQLAHMFNSRPDLYRIVI